MSGSTYTTVLNELKRLESLDVCFSRRVLEDHHVAGDDESVRYIRGTSYPENSDYILFAKEVNSLFEIRGKTVFEFCTGPGRLSLELAKHQPKTVIGFDGALTMIKNALTLKLDMTNLEYVCADLFELDMTFASADLVVCQNSLHHFDGEGLADFIRLALSCLTSGGYIYISDYRREELQPGVLYQRLEETHASVRDDLINTIKASFTRVELISMLSEFSDEIEFEVFYPNHIFKELQLSGDYQEIVSNDPHPHYLDYDLSLRVKIRKK